jgi:hypothetical protein
MESYKSFKYNKHKVQRNPELDRPLNKWYVDKKMLIEDLSQGMVERKRMSQMIMQSKRPGEGANVLQRFFSITNLTIQETRSKENSLVELC